MTSVIIGINNTVQVAYAAVLLGFLFGSPLADLFCYASADAFCHLPFALQHCWLF